MLHVDRHESASHGDRFELRDKLGSGGMGVVFRAFDHQLDREVAVKTLRQTSGRELYRFKREFRALTDIVHPNLVALHELHTAGDDWFFSMELVDGVSFADWVRSGVHADEATQGGFGAEVTSPTRAPFDFAVAAPIDLDRLGDALAQLVDAVLALHISGKLHRDLKPSNVMVTAKGRVVVLDFGLVSDVDARLTDLTHERAAVGTPAYMSPEQAADQPLTEASDWYAIGVMLYEALTGRRPFEGSAEQMMRRKQREAPVPPSHHVAGVPAELDQLCMRLLSHDPADRPDGRAVLTALGRGPSRTTLELERSQAGAPFVGRTDELHLLRRAFHTSRRHGVAVFVRGRSGMGKSQLVRHFLDEIAPQSLILEGRCYPSESVPYKSLDAVVDALTGALLRLPGNRLESVIPREVAALARLFPVLRRVERIEERTVMCALPPDLFEVRRRAFAALRYILAKLAAQGPVVVAIDDLQWGDADSAVFLAELIHHPEPLPILLVLIHTDDDNGVIAGIEESRPGIPTGDTRTLELGPMPETEARQLVRALHGAVDDSADALIREGGGHPLFLAELARSERDDDGASLDELLGRRIAALPVAAAQLLSAIAVAARPVPVDQAQRATGRSVGTELALLRTERLIRVSHGGEGKRPCIEPYHDRIRAAALATLGDNERRWFHAALAREAETDGATDLEALIEHWTAAGEPVRAASYALRAARVAEEKLAFHRAAALYALVLDRGNAVAEERRQLLHLRGNALANAGALDAAGAAYSEALKGASPEQALELNRLRLEQMLRRGRLEEARTLLHEVLASVDVKVPRSSAGALRAAAFERLRLKLHLRRRGLDYVEHDAAEVAPAVLRKLDVLNSAASACAFVDPILGKALQFRFLRTALDAGEPKLLTRALCEEMGYQAMAGVQNKPQVDAVVSALSKVSARTTHPGLAGFATGSEGLGQYLMGNWREAARLLEQGMKAMRDHTTGLRWETTLAELYLVSSLYYLGETRELARLVPLFLRDAIDRGDVYAQHGLRAWRSNVAWLVMGRPDEARAQARELAASRGDSFHLHHWFEILAQTQIDLYTGDVEPAWQRMEAAWPRLRASHLLRVQNIRIETSFLRARVLIARAQQGGPDRLRLLAECERIAKALDREGAGWATAFGQHLRAMVAWCRGDAAGAEAGFELAERAYTAADMRLFAAVSRLHRGHARGGPLGGAWAADAQLFMQSQNIADPEAMARMLCPL